MSFQQFNNGKYCYLAFIQFAFFKGLAEISEYNKKSIVNLCLLKCFTSPGLPGSIILHVNSVNGNFAKNFYEFNHLLKLNVKKTMYAQPL